MTEHHIHNYQPAEWLFFIDATTIIEDWLCPCGSVRTRVWDMATGERTE